MQPRNTKVSDYFAELYVAGKLADAGWNVYFPHRDEGFDFIIAKQIDKQMVIRPVQVKGKYPTGEKTDKPVYGYRGRLSQLHPEMVLAIPYFFTTRPVAAPAFVAYMPVSQVRPYSRGYRCEPASFRRGEAKQRQGYTDFFDGKGIASLESEGWKNALVHDKY